MKTISDMIGMKTALQNQQIQQQAIQSGAMANEQSQIDLQETKASRSVLANWKNYLDSDGNLDFNKLGPDIMSVAPKNGSAILSNVLQAQNSANVAKQSWLGVGQSQRDAIGKIAYSLQGQSPEVVAKTWDALSAAPAFQKMSPALTHFWSTAVGPAVQGGNQKAIDDALGHVGKMAEAPSTQQGMNTPGGIAVSNGQQSAVVSTKPGTGVSPGDIIPGTNQQQQLPPGTPVINDQGQPGYLGPQPGGGNAVFDLSGDRTRDFGMLNSIANDRKQPIDIRQQAAAKLREVQGRGFVASGLPPGQAQSIEGNVQEMNRHFASLNDASTGAQLIEGLTGNIKSLAPGAATGTEAGRKAYLAGLLNAMHLGGQASGDYQKDTDLLEKNMAQLGLATPATSDAMRTLVMAARPHSTMSEGAITEAADQVASQVKANMVMRNALQGYRLVGDVQGYAAARQKLEGVMDPRAFQFESADASGRKAMLEKLTPDDRTKLRGKIEQLVGMGILK